MDVFRRLEDVPQDFGATVLCVGNFDGVHRAHRELIANLVTRARDLNARAMLVCFEPHPLRILQPDAPLKLITPTPVKLELLAGTGTDAVLLLPFSRDLSVMPPRQFVEEILVEKLRASEVHEGFNFRFGHKAAGDTSLLRELGQEFGFEVRVYPATHVHGQVVSSSRVRELVSQGEVRLVRHMLGRPFSVRHTPGRGRGYGHKYTVPTINLGHYGELVPQDGVYVTRTLVQGECFDSVTNVGNRPTFGDEMFAIETHLLNFHPIELTPESSVELQFLRRIRPEMRFPSVEALRHQIALDVRLARRYFHLLSAAQESGRQYAGPARLMTSPR